MTDDFEENPIKLTGFVEALLGTRNRLLDQLASTYGATFYIVVSDREVMMNNDPKAIEELILTKAKIQVKGALRELDQRLKELSND